MGKTFQTEQERFWAGSFGDQYKERNAGEQWVASNTHFFAHVLARVAGLNSILELGSNTGLNLRALHRLFPDAHLTGIEINAAAADELRQWGEAEVIEGSFFELDLDQSRSWDMVFTKGVLIHQHPERLNDAYDVLASLSRRYVCIAEYYNPSPVTIPYRGHDDRLFKRDFAGEFMARHGFELVDYGFAYHGDPVAPQDDLTWFLMRRP